ILLNASPLHVALVIAGVFKRYRGLEGEAFNEVGFVEGEFAAIGRSDYKLRHALAFAVLKKIERQCWAIFGLFGRIGDFAVAKARAGKCGARHLDSADDDAKDRAKDGFFADGGVHLARRLEQSLQACDLLLKIDGFVAA